MRLRRLSLDRFGHFTDKFFDFGESSGKPDFHIIYGPNEAGKTTTMESALRLFYGFKTREDYDFKHQRKNLQVSAQLEINGQLRQFTRLPKRTASLLDENGIALPETALANYLAGLSEDDYRKLLCLDDDTIERGGDEIAQADGDIGRLLFSAAAGVADLTSVLTEVRESADELWRKRAAKTRTATLKREWSEVHAKIKQLDVLAPRWRTLKKQFSRAQTAENSARTLLNRQRKTESLIRARRRALPILTEIDSLASRTAGYKNYPELLDFDLEDLVKLQGEEQQLTADLKRLCDEIEDAGSQLEGLKRDPQLAALSVRLDQLEALRARDLTATQDLDRRRIEIQNERIAVQSAARDLGAGDSIDPQTLVLSSDAIQRLSGARDKLRATQTALATEIKEVADLAELCEVARQQVDKITGDTSAEHGIGHVLENYDAERLAPAYSAVQQNVMNAELAVTKALAALCVGAVEYEALPSLANGSIKARKWLDDHEAQERQISTLDSEVANFRKDIAAREAHIEILKRDRNLVADSQASALKNQRDHLWQVHKDSLNQQTAHDFEKVLMEHDSAADSRLLNATDLGELRLNELSLREIQARLAQTEQQLAACHRTKTEIENDVVNAANAVGIESPLLPAEWLDWVQLHEGAAEMISELTMVRQRHQSELDRGQQLHAALCQHMNNESLDFDGALYQAKALANNEREAISAVTAAISKLDDSNAALTRRQLKKQDAEQENRAAMQDWTNLLTELVGDAQFQNALLRSLEPLRKLREHNDKLTKTIQRVEAMEKDQAQFTQAIAALCESHEVSMDGNAGSTYELLRKKSSDAQAAEASAAKYAKDIENSKATHAQRQQDLKNIHAKVKSIGSIFPNTVEVSTLEKLRPLAAQAQQVIGERKKQRDLERQVTAELNSANFDDARELLDGVTEAELHAEEEENKTAIQDADQQLTQATEARVQAANELQGVAGGAEIHVLTERKTTIELELESTAIEYLELSLGHLLANKAIQRYQDNHRSGMMAATEKCFALLTDGAYPQLATESSGNSEALLAINKEGATKRVAALSKGTRFQLYLALRAAAHEQMVSQGTSLPFFCDDVFETFDETRTSAACQVMEQIGTRGQAIYLTHHRHVVEIAKQVCSVVPTIHEIEGI